MRYFLQLSAKHYLLILVSITLVITYLMQEYVSVPQISTMPVVSEVIRTRALETFYRWRWALLFVPIAIMLLRLLLVAFCLFLGSFFNEQFQGMSFAHCWNIAVKADTVNVLYNVLTCVCSILLGVEVWAEFNRNVSFMFLVSPNITDQWLLVPIAALNIFEVCYWLFMAGLLSVRQVGVRFSIALRYTMSTYGVGYLFYIVFLMFLLLYLA